MRGEQQVAGLWCSEVLAALSDYLGGELPPERRAAIEAHVRSCDHCTRFGGHFAGVVKALRVELGVTEPPPEVRARLAAKLGL